MPLWRARPSCRLLSPFGGSILITSAPMSARIWQAHGPSTTLVSSTTRTPLSGPGMQISSGRCPALVLGVPGPLERLGERVAVADVFRHRKAQQFAPLVTVAAHHGH